MYITPEIIVKAGIAQGAVYNFSPESNVANHWYVVINKEPKNDSEIFMLRFTSKKEKQIDFVKRRGLDPWTIVELSDGECDYVLRREDTCINCNYVQECDISFIIERMELSGGLPYPVIEGELLSRIIEGVKRSKMVKPKVLERI